MVDKKYAHTTIEQDLEIIELAYSSISEHNISELPIVNVIDSKPGLDDVNGKYYVEGAVVTGKVSSRGKNSRSGDANGYKIARFLCDDDGLVVKDSNNEPTIVEEKLVTKEQGVHLIQFMGSKNAYLRIQEITDKYNKDLILKTTVYLRPFPAKTQAFFLDGRVVKVYETDEYGNRINPIKLKVNKSECTQKMWSIIYSDYNFKRKREKPKKNVVESRKENERKLNSIKKTLIQSNNALINPFKK